MKAKDKIIKIKKIKIIKKNLHRKKKYIWHRIMLARWLREINKNLIK